MVKTIEEHNLKVLFKNSDINFKIPNYQRAYSWGEKQLNDFIKDLNEYEQGEYYYGHFILEKSEEAYYIIDGQQRLTTYVLFLLVYRKITQNNTLDAVIDKLETVDYDQESFTKIKENINKLSLEDKWDEKSFQLDPDNQTTSILRMIEALEFFRNSFEGKEPKLNKEKLTKYLNVLDEAIVSTHITNSKSISAQIFELHNTRGLKLDIIERIKSKLMRSVLLSDNENKEDIIQNIQDNFGKIYKLEDKILRLTFFNKLSILLPIL